MRWTVTQIIEATKGQLLCGNAESIFTGISIDSRRISSGDLFVAIRGNTHDGHRFVVDVLQKGVCGLLIKAAHAKSFPVSEWGAQNIVCVAVDDTITALGDIAAHGRFHSNVSVIAITGSNGKTTTREMTSAVVSRRFKTLSTKGNFNNEIGLPLTLFGLESWHEWAVLELGMNRPGEIRRLAEICQPDIGVITNIGPAHLEGLGTIDGVMHAKGELLEKINNGGTAVLNADDSRIMQLSEKTDTKVLFYGFSDHARIRADQVCDADNGISFMLHLPGKSIVVNLKVHGNFMVSNALAAAGTGHLLGLSAQQIKAGLEEFIPVHGRMNLIKTQKGINIIDDTYNANPSSMQAAILTLKTMSQGKRSILVSGDMNELGERSGFFHNEIGAISALSGISWLYSTGEFSESVAEGAMGQNMSSKRIMTGSLDAIYQDLVSRLNPGDWVLVKGSRTMGMERMVEKLKEWGEKS